METTCLDAYAFAPYVLIESPLYTAIIDGERETCVWIAYRVRAEDVEADNETGRQWWCPPELRDYCLVAEEYRRSGWDRGHLRSIQMSRGSRHWQDVNLTAVIVPQSPELNRGAIAQLEGEICDLAAEHGWCEVTINLSGDIGDLPLAEETSVIPASIRYLIQSPAGVQEVTFENGVSE